MTTPDEWFDWVRAHSAPRPGEEPRRMGLMLLDPVPPPGGVPRWVLEGLTDGDPIRVRREERPDSPRPDFLLWTASGHFVGRVPDDARGFLEALRLEGFQLEVVVFAAVPFFPPETALQLEARALYWPGDDPVPPRPGGDPEGTTHYRACDLDG